MRGSKIVNVRRLAAAGALAVSLLGARAQAQVLEQIPSDATGVFEIKSLSGLNTKVAKLAKTFGLDEINPEMKDPLSALLEKGHLTKGVDKSGDAAMAIFAPKDLEHKEGAKPQEPDVIALVPVSDYDAFVGNFKKADDAEAGGDISAVKDPEHGNETMYIAHHGKYAVMSDKRAHLTDKALGIKLGGAALKEIDANDAVFFFNVPNLRERVLPEIKAHRKEWLADIDKELAGQEQAKPFGPVIDTLVNEALDVAQTFLTDANSIVFSVNLSDEGMTGGALVEFAPDSKYGKYVADLKPGHTPLLAGLPDHKYFVFGGMSWDAKALTPLADELIDPLIKGLNDSNNDTGKKIASALGSMKTVLASTNHQASGWIMPTKPLGQESLSQQVSVVYGDAKAIAGAEKSMLGDVSDLMALAPKDAGAKPKIVFGDPKTVDGATLETYTTKLGIDENDPKMMQAQQMLAMLYGPNGMSGTFGAVDDKTFIVGQGISDELLKELVASAKSGKDVLSDNAGVKSVIAQLPKNSTGLYFVDLDNIVTSAVKYAQGFGVPIKMTLPADLPPIGISTGAEGTAVRIDGFIPALTVQNLIAAGIKAYTQMQQGGAGGL